MKKKRSSLDIKKLIIVLIITNILLVSILILPNKIILKW